jgi:hypothetical protein
MLTLDQNLELSQLKLYMPPASHAALVICLWGLCWRSCDKGWNMQSIRHGHGLP